MHTKYFASITLIFVCFVQRSDARVRYDIEEIQEPLNATCNPDIPQQVVTEDLTYLAFKQDDPSCLTQFAFPRQENVCQLKFEFKSFKTAGPSPFGDCLSDSVTFKAENLATPLVICGSDPGDNHVFLHYGDSNRLYVNFDILDTTSEIAILVKQITCDDENKAPEGCTQFYIQQRGNVRGFNYGGQQLNNQIYSACVKGDQGTQSISWSRCNMSQATDFQIVGPSHPPDSHCQTDSVTIPGSSNSIYCQPASFMQPVKSSAKPFILYVHLNSEEMQTDFGPAPPGNNGCPSGFTWVGPDPTNGNVGFCQPNAAPNPFSTLDDMDNTAFCLRYQRDL